LWKVVKPTATHLLVQKENASANYNDYPFTYAFHF
jgi:hypothetical protein